MSFFRMLNSLRLLTVSFRPSAVSLMKPKSLSTSAFIRPPKILALNALENIPGSKKKVIFISKEIKSNKLKLNSKIKI